MKPSRYTEIVAVLCATQTRFAVELHLDPDPLGEIRRLGGCSTRQTAIEFREKFAPSWCRMLSRGLWSGA